MKTLKMKLVRAAAHFVKKKFQERWTQDYPYHNLRHTVGVVKAAKRIARKYELDKNELVVLLVSAWFHDVDVFMNSLKHEACEASLAEQFLLKQKVNVEVIPVFEHAILATRLPQCPSNLVEEILCDADLYHLGTSRFRHSIKSLRKENQLRGVVHMSKEEWLESNIKRLETHLYFTDYARVKLRKGLKKNLQKLVTRKNNVRA